MKHLTVKEAAKYLNINLSSFYKKLSAGSIKPIEESGKDKLFLKSDLDEYLESRKKVKIDIDTLRRMNDRGVKRKDMAKAFGVGVYTIQRICVENNIKSIGYVAERERKVSKKQSVFNEFLFNHVKAIGG